LFVHGLKALRHRFKAFVTSEGVQVCARTRGESGGTARSRWRVCRVW